MLAGSVIETRAVKHTQSGLQWEKLHCMPNLSSGTALSALQCYAAGVP